MANKYYKKRGNLNWKERKLLGDIEEAIEKNPGIGNIEPATTFDELEKLQRRSFVPDRLKAGPVNADDP